MKTLKTVIGWFVTAIVAVAVVVVAFMFIGPRFGFDTHPILSGSMEPALGVGGVIVTRPVRVSEVKVEDIITFQLQDQLVTHRVVEISHKEGETKTWFKTKGDANKDPDANLVSFNRDLVPETFFYVPYLGYLAALIKNKASFLVLMGVPALVLVGLIFREMWRGVLDEKAKRKRQCPEPDA